MIDPATTFFCSRIEDFCPYDWECDDCEVFKACEKAKELSVLLQNQTEQDRYDEYHADDWKKTDEDWGLGE